MWDVMIAYHGTNDTKNGSAEMAGKIYEHLTKNGKKVFWFPANSNELGKDYKETTYVAADSRYFVLVVNDGIKNTGRHLTDKGELVANTPIYNEISSFYDHQITGKSKSAKSKFIVYCYGGFSCEDAEKLYPLVTSGHLCMENEPYTKVLEVMNDCDAENIKAVCDRLIKDIQDDRPDDKLIASFEYKGSNYSNLGELINSRRVIGKAEDDVKVRHIHISSDGGYGKSTQMRYFARKLNSEGRPAVYIDCKKIDQLSKEDEIRGFVVDTICDAFGDMLDGGRSNSKYTKLKDYIKYTLGSLTIFLDGENEVTDGEEIIRQINHLLEEIANSNFIQVVVSSRYLNEIYEKNEMTCVTMNPLDIEYVLRDNPEKLEKYKTLDERTRNMLLLPMFLRLFIESDDDNITPANLLLRDYERTAENLYNFRGINVGVVLYDFLPEFTWEMYKKNGKMAFTANELRDYFEASALRNKDFDLVVNALKSASYVVTSDDINFTFRHEHIRDFLVAYYLKKRINEADTYSTWETISELFPEKKMYGLFVLQFFAELMEKNGLNEALDYLRKNKMDKDEWRRKATAIATSEIIEAFKALAEESFDEVDFTGLNLTETKLNEVKIFDASFEDSMVNDQTFAPEGQSTGIFYVAEHNEHIYVLGKKELIRYSRSFEKEDSVTCDLKRWNLSSASSSKAMVTVDYDGDAFFFTLGEKMTSKSLGFSDAYYVEAESTGDFIVGFKSGEMKLIKSDGSVKDFEKVDDKNVLPICKKGRNGFYYATGKEIKCLKTHKTEVYWQMPEDDNEPKDEDKKFEIKEAKYFSKGDMAIVAISRLGATYVYSVSLRDASCTLVDKKIEPKAQKTINFNAALCNEIAICGECIALSYNSGDVAIYQYDPKAREKWRTLGRIFVVKNSGTTGGMGVESACITQEGIVCGLTDRNIKCVSFDPKSSANSGFVKRLVSGRHDGLRKIYRVDDNKIIVNTYDGSFVELVRDDTDSCFNFEDKVTPWRRCWSWACEVITDGIYFVGAYERLYLYNNGTITEMNVSFNRRIDALMCRDNMLFVACNNKIVYKVPLDEDYNISGNTESFDIDEYDRAAICFAMHPQTKEIYVGFNSHKNKKGSVIKVIKGDKLVDVEKTQQVFDDGWYRHIEFSYDGEYILCAGLRSQADDGKVSDLTIVFDRDFNVVARLLGHKASVLCARFISIDDGKLAVASCSDDGLVNLYEFAPQSGIELELEPNVSKDLKKGKLFDLVIDGNDILVTCIDGGLYRWHNFMENSEEITADYKNVSGLYTVNSDFSNIDCQSEIYRIKEGLESLNNTMPEQESEDSE